MARALRIYSEMAPLGEATAPAAVRLLARYDVELAVAVRPADLTTLGDAVSRLVDANVAVSLWPMLDDEHGRFLNHWNVARMREHALRTHDVAYATAPSATFDVMLDVEPPVELLRAVTHRNVRAALAAPKPTRRLAVAGDAAAALLLAELRGRGATVSTAQMPHVLFPGGRRVAGWLGVPQLEGVDSVDVMLYRTLARQVFRPLLSRGAAIRALGPLAARAEARAMRVALGCVGTGALGTEPVYDDARDLADDVAAARRAGVTRFALFEWSAVLRRAPSEAWLDAISA